ncbi:MAG: PIG-L deacetylase family protein [Patescibacteria group bacterium]
MKIKNIVAVFAHPDDEAFGPSGTLALLAKEYNVYLLCATKGEAGAGGKNAGNIREGELLNSAKILGIKAVHFLGFADGTLCNNVYHKFASAIKPYLEKYKPERVITFEMLGVSGHIDHITVSMVVTFLFEKLKYIKEVWYFCNNKSFRKFVPDYFIYFPEGYDRDKVDKIVDVTSVWDTKVASAKAHVSQKHDFDMIYKIFKLLNKLHLFKKEELFLVKKR